MKNILLTIFTFISSTIYRCWLFFWQKLFEVVYILAKKAYSEIKQTRKERGWYTDFTQKYSYKHLERLSYLLPTELQLTYGEVDRFYDSRLSKNICYKIIEIAKLERGNRQKEDIKSGKNNNSFQMKLLRLRDKFLTQNQKNDLEAYQ